MLKHPVGCCTSAIWWLSAVVLARTAAAHQSQAEGVLAKSAVPTALLIQTTWRQLPSIDKVQASDMPGLFIVRLGQQMFYSDAQANFLIRGGLIDARSMRNLMQECVVKLKAIDFAQLSFKDVLEWRNSQPKHLVAVFVDTNSGYCLAGNCEFRAHQLFSLRTTHKARASCAMSKFMRLWGGKNAIFSDAANSTFRHAPLHIAF